MRVFYHCEKGAIMRVVRAVVRRTRPENQKTTQKQGVLTVMGRLTWTCGMVEWMYAAYGVSLLH